MKKPRLTKTQWAQLTVAVLGATGTAGIKAAVRSIGAARVAQAREGVDPRIKRSDVQALRKNFAGVLSVRKLLDILWRVLGEEKVFELIAWLEHVLRGERPGERPPQDGGPTGPVPGPGPGLTVEQRLARPWVLMSFPHYYFRDVVSRGGLVEWADAIRWEGLDGAGIELNGPWPSLEWRKIAVNPDVAAEYEQSLAALALIAPVFAERGLLLEVKVLNTNTRHANSRPDGWWRELGVRLGQQFGRYPGMLWMPQNEADDRTRVSVGQNIRAGLIAGGIPKARLVAWKTRGDSGYVEHHPGRSDATDIKRGGREVINSNDSGNAISALYGKDWPAGGVPNEAAIEAWVTRCLGAGTNCEIYGFGKEEDYKGLAAAGRAVRRFRGEDLNKEGTEGTEKPGGRPPQDGGPTGGGATGDEIDLSKVRFIHTDIRGWAVRSPLAVTLTGSTVRMDQTLTKTLEAVDAKVGNLVCANAWVIARIGGELVAATWEWFKQNQVSKAKKAVAGDHVKKAPYPANWRPGPGEELWFAVSGLARNAVRNEKVRTPFVRVVWK